MAFTHAHAVRSSYGRGTLPKLIEKYSETLIDIDDPEPPYLFVFGDEINNRQIYIKLKIKEKTHKHILCVSFHYAKWKMRFPFKHN